METWNPLVLDSCAEGEIQVCHSITVTKSLTCSGIGQVEGWGKAKCGSNAPVVWGQWSFQGLLSGLAAVHALEDSSNENDRVRSDNSRVRACWERRPLRAASRKTLISCSYGADFIRNQTQEFQRKVKVQPSKISSALPSGSTVLLAIISVLTQAMKGKANVAECKLCMFPETWALFPRLT